MVKHLLFSLLSVFVSLLTFSQGSESFSNTNSSVGSSYTLINWTGDNGLPWSATSARNDESGSVTGMTGDYLIVRNTGGIIKCLDIPGGCGEVTFKYAKAFTSTTNLPTFGLFIEGVQYGATITASSNAATSITIPVNFNGSFDLEIRQLTANDNGRLAIDDIAWTGFNNNPPCVTPLAQPTSLVLSSTPNTVSGSFDDSGADNYLVVRSTSSTLSATPVNGTAYLAGQALGGGTVVGVYAGSSFIDINLTPSTQYYYFIFALNSEDCTGGPNYFIPSPLTSSISTQAIPPCVAPAVPTGLNLTAANNFINGSFNAVAGANRYLVIISTSSTLSASPVNGTTYNAGQAFGGGTVVSFGAAINFTATSLNTNTQYYFFVFAATAECTGQPFYSVSSLNGNSTTTNTSTGIPNGYYNTAEGLSCQPLKSALKTIISNSAVNIGYDGLWTAYQYTDIKPGTTNIIWDIYTDDNNPAVPETFNFVYGSDQCGNYDEEGDCYNREHSTPKSWFNDAAPMHNDIFHVLPTDGWVNGARSNWPYGEVTNANFTSIDNQSKRGTGNNFGYTGTVFQPHAAFRGDVARISLYMATRYEDQIISQNWAGANSEAGPAMLTAGEEGFDADRRRLQIYNTWYIRTMFKWMSEDPVSQKEIDRNNAVYYQSGQNNRNPFVDRPEFAALIWQCTGVLPVTITDFVAQKQNESVLLKWYATYETNFRLFEIERSTDGIGFYKIGEIAGQNFANYSFNDNELPTSSIIYYRLKMIDIDGTFNYSKIISVRLNNNFSNALVYPNPTTGPLNIKLAESIKNNTTLDVTDVTGRVVKQQQVNKGVVNINLEVSKLPAGRYFIRINDQQNLIRQSFVIAK